MVYTGYMKYLRKIAIILTIMTMIAEIIIKISWDVVHTMVE